MPESGRSNRGGFPLGWLRRAAAVLLAVGWMAGAGMARASVSLLVEEPYGHLGTFNPAGHSAIYLDHVCADGPLQLRPCRFDELGVVISRYDGIGNHDWAAMPLMAYLYAVDKASEIPETATREQVTLLRDNYRRRHLEMLAADLANGTAPPGNWYELVGASYDRTIYGFRVKTTAEQDAALIAKFNDLKNTEHYNGAFRNCADFARTTINLYYPHAVRRNLIADFGITSPKSVARSLAHYAHKHPEAGLEVFVIPQVKGELPRSGQIEDVAESLLKRYGLPLVAISPTTTAVVLAAYIGHGRFRMPKDPPTLDVAELEENAAFPEVVEMQTERKEGRLPLVMGNRELLTRDGVKHPAGADGGGVGLGRSLSR
jgi:hypothetical protein